MNIKDLTIGNWVYYDSNPNSPTRVVNIGSYSVSLEYYGREGYVFVPSVEDIQPIKVTDEILIKTGFNKEDRTDDSEYYGVDDSRGSVFRRWIGTDDYIVSIYENTNRLGGKRWCSIDNYKQEYVGAFHFTYVHELQNGIRLITKQDLDVKL